MGMMDMSLEGQGEEWFSSRPGTGLIYRLIGEARDSRGRDERIRSIIALGETGDPRAVRVLVECCSDGDMEVRGHAVKALRKLRSCRAVPALLERLGDRHEQRFIRQHAAIALGEIRGYSAMEGLRRVMADETEDPAIRSFIAKIVGRACAGSRTKRIRKGEALRSPGDLTGPQETAGYRLKV
jgi:HEAT repeats